MRGFIVGVVTGAVLATAGAAAARKVARVDTNGVLVGYTVQKGERTVCRNPEVWNDFRGEGSFIVCP